MGRDSKSPEKSLNPGTLLALYLSLVLDLAQLLTLGWKLSLGLRWVLLVQPAVIFIMALVLQPTINSSTVRSAFLRAAFPVLSVMTLVALGVLCWTASSLWTEFQAFQDQKNIEELNQIVMRYKEKAGKLPDLNLVDLYHHGLTERRLHQTPFGGYYRLDPRQASVYNPNR